jgi:hypothetical protein
MTEAMSERVLVATDIGIIQRDPTQPIAKHKSSLDIHRDFERPQHMVAEIRTAVHGLDGRRLIERKSSIGIHRYDVVIEHIAEHATTSAHLHGSEIAAVTVALPAQVTDGVLTKAGVLKEWVEDEHNMRDDLASALDRPDDIEILNDVVAIAKSQHAVNLQHKRPAHGIATLLGNGWGGALYWEDGTTASDEPGHQPFRHGATCTCGVDGHAEAYLSRQGVFGNYTKDLNKLLEDRTDFRPEYVRNLTEAVVGMLERHKEERGFWPQELRWMGEVISAHPFVLGEVATNVHERFDDNAPAFDLVRYGVGAKLHGAMIDAKQRVEAKG